MENYQNWMYTIGRDSHSVIRQSPVAQLNHKDATETAHLKQNYRMNSNVESSSHAVDEEFIARIKQGELIQSEREKAEKEEEDMINNRYKYNQPVHPVIMQLVAMSKSDIDVESDKGRFGWSPPIDGDPKNSIPHIYRGETKYCSVRIAEKKLLYKYLEQVPQTVVDANQIPCEKMTYSEIHLFNEINTFHCNSQFGKERFRFLDLIVKEDDLKKLYDTLRSYCEKPVKKILPLAQDGTIRIGNQMIPYFERSGTRFIPLFCFIGDKKDPRERASKLSNLDTSTIEVCSDVPGKPNKLTDSSCMAMSLPQLRKCYKPPSYKRKAEASQLEKLPSIDTLKRPKLNVRDSNPKQAVTTCSAGNKTKTSNNTSKSVIAPYKNWARAPKRQQMCPAGRATESTATRNVPQAATFKNQGQVATAPTKTYPAVSRIIPSHTQEIVVPKPSVKPAATRIILITETEHVTLNPPTRTPILLKLLTVEPAKQQGIPTPSYANSQELDIIDLTGDE